MSGEQPGSSKGEENGLNNNTCTDINDVVIDEELFVEDGLEDLDLDDSDSDD